LATFSGFRRSWLTLPANRVEPLVLSLEPSLALLPGCDVPEHEHPSALDTFADGRDREREVALLAVQADRNFGIGVGGVREPTPHLPGNGLEKLRSRHPDVVPTDPERLSGGAVRVDDAVLLVQRHHGIAHLAHRGPASDRRDVEKAAAVQRHGERDQRHRPAEHRVVVPHRAAGQNRGVENTHDEGGSDGQREQPRLSPPDTRRSSARDCQQRRPDQDVDVRDAEQGPEPDLVVGVELCADQFVRFADDDATGVDPRDEPRRQNVSAENGDVSPIHHRDVRDFEGEKEPRDADEDASRHDSLCQRDRGGGARRQQVRPGGDRVRCDGDGEQPEAPTAGFVSVLPGGLQKRQRPDSREYLSRSHELGRDHPYTGVGRKINSIFLPVVGTQ
jgi:hypothetical protein